MPKEQNLKCLSANEARGKGKKSGFEAGEEQTEGKPLKEELLSLLRQDDLQKKMCQAMIAQAEGGNTRAFEVVRDTIGEKPVKEVELNGNLNTAIAEIDALVRSCREGGVCGGGEL